MTTLLLSTKLYLPPVRPDLILRPRLHQRLDETLHRKLTLLSAPAGFGKTTLLVHWAACLSERAQVAWLSIDQADNDPARFIRYLLAAVQQIHPHLAEAALSSLDLPRPQFEPLLTALINDLAALTTPLVLILDDYHWIDEAAIHQALDFLIDHLPAHVHLVLATRADPPLRLSRLRGGGGLNEVRLADLRFTHDEAAAFLNQAMGLSLLPDQVASLASRTEGWIAGLQLAALSLRSQEDPEQFVRTFTGSTRFILDYLTEEVFQAQPVHIQDFLRQTAILDRLSGPLCDAVCQSSPGISQQILDELERANLFIFPLDDRREWRRYHQLFADLLRMRLEQDQPGLIPGLYQRASAWFEQNDFPYEAIEYAFSAGDPEHTAGLIEGVSQILLMHGQSATLLRWLERLPPAVLDQRLSLAADHAWAMLFCSRPIESIHACIERIDANPSGVAGTVAIEAAPLAIRMLPLRALLALYSGHPAQAQEMAAQALAQLGVDEIYLRGIASLVHAMAISAGDDPLLGFEAFQQAISAGVKTGNLLVSILGLLSLAENERKLGLLHRTQAHLEQALQLAVDSQGRRLPVAGRLLIGLGDLAREWNDLEGARRLTQEGLALLEQSELVGAFQGHMVLARIEHASGDLTASRQAIRQAWRWARAFDASDLDDLTVALLEVRLAISQGNTPLAFRWAKERGLLAEASPSLPTGVWDDYNARLRKYELVVLARLWLAGGQPERALPLLDALYVEFERINRPWLMIEIRLLQAMACDALEDESQSLGYLEHAIALAEPEGYVRIFLDEGTQLMVMLRRLAVHAPPDRPASTQAYIHRLLAAAPEEPQGPAAPQISRGDALTSREIDVLRLLASSLSASEIANELVVSPNTIHSHIKSIYAKLGVHSRYQAIARAKALSLI